MTVNKDRRKQIADIVAQVAELAGQRDELVNAIESVRDDEQEYLDAMPESLQGGDKGERAQAAIDALDEAKDALDEIDLDAVTNALETAAE